MRTEEDLHAAFDHLADSAPAADDILASLTAEPRTRPVRRNRTPLVLATVLATAAAAIGGPLLVSHLKSPEQAGELFTGSAWAPWITVTAPKSMTINPRINTANRQVWELFRTVQPWPASCLVTAHRNGDFDPATIPADSPTVDINGAKGRVITSAKDKVLVPLPNSSMQPAYPAYPLKTVAWQPARGLWALVTCETQLEGGTRQTPKFGTPWKVDLPQAMEIARTISTGGRLASPYKIGYLPAGMKPNQITATRPADGIAESKEIFYTLLSDGDPATGHRPTAQALSRWNPKPGDDVSIRYDASKFWNLLGRHGTSKPNLSINGVNAWYLDSSAGFNPDNYLLGPVPSAANPKSATIRMEGRGMAVTIQSFSGTVGRAELVKIAQHLQLAPSTTDLTTWYDAATAIPSA
ncbi:hypothetical protein [Streptomyces sp. SID13031]|uniref:hypothetical protein n=1 Tax=Streptomyces sp. SID13031 TaxID=2706046 RepID=UPI0013C7479B|nr:hypothetical protein [Streptomyces sp. SID13031]NEA36626.1 hypothetical protein [Streptomyces sp. SID13031]